MEEVFAAETRCQATYAQTKEPCREWARYREDLDIDNDGDDNDREEGRLLCGIHCKKGKRKELPLNPKADELRAMLVAQRVVEANAQAARNIQLGKSGSVTAAAFAGLFREKSFEPTKGSLPIFPNYRHGKGYGYGYDFSMMSPMCLGPVKHSQPSLPEAKIHENFWQSGKVYPNELASELCECPRALEWSHFKPAPEFYSRRLAAYLDSKAHRHKFPDVKLKAANKAFVKPGGKSGGKRKRKQQKTPPNKPMYIVHETQAGEERHYTYMEARVFYARHLETLILQKCGQEWGALRGLIANGYDIQIVGYDAYTPRNTDADTLYEHYLDDTRPFGHEMVILAMLCIPQVDQRPWHRYYREHLELYE